MFLFPSAESCQRFVTHMGWRFIALDHFISVFFFIIVYFPLFLTSTTQGLSENMSYMYITWMI